MGLLDCTPDYMPTTITKSDLTRLRFSCCIDGNDGITRGVFTTGIDLLIDSKVSMAFILLDIGVELKEQKFCTIRIVPRSLSTHQICKNNPFKETGHWDLSVEKPVTINIYNIDEGKMVMTPTYLRNLMIDMVNHEKILAIETRTKIRKNLKCVDFFDIL